MKSNRQRSRCKIVALLASLFLCVFALNGAAQTILTADGLAAFGTTAAASGGGGASYANTGGQGNRSTIITATDQNVLTDPAHLVDGTYSDGSAFWANGQVLDGSTTWVLFDFGSGHSAQIVELTYYQSTTTAEGTWQLQGSNDNVSYSNIGSTFSLGGATTQVITAPSGNTTFFRYYRMLGVSGTLSFTPWVRGMDFKLNYL